jgi:integrase
MEAHGSEIVNIQVPIDDDEPYPEFPSRERSPFADLGASLDLIGGGFEAAVSFCLTKPIIEGAGAIGQLLASAIWNGALLERESWQRWLDSLPTGARLGKSLWVEMDAADPVSNGDVLAPPKRWFADPVSQILILRWLAALPTNPCTLGSAEDCLRDYLLMSGSRSQARDPVTDFLRAAELRWRVLMPGVLVDYATGRSPSISCSSATFTRVVTGRAVPVKKIEPLGVEKRTWEWGDCGKWPEDKLHHWTLVEILRGASTDDSVLGKRQQRNEAVQKLQNMNVPSYVSPLAKLLHRFALAMVTEGLQTNGKHYRPGPARENLKVLRAEVLYPGSGLDSLSADADALRQHCLDAVLRLPPCEYRNKVMNAIQAFSRFLHASEHELSFAELDFKGLYVPSTPRVNLLSSSDYEAALACLKDRTAVDIRMLRICLILGFRCGMRLIEIRALTVSDITVFGDGDEQQVELVIRRNRQANTKTDWSRRVLPLHLLLSRNADPSLCEITEFLGWWRDGKRLSQLTGNAFLFVVPDRPFERVRHQVDLEIPLNLIVRKVTYDENITFGALRHSFVSNLLSTVLLPGDGTCLPFPAGLDDQCLSLARKARLERGLIGEEKLGQAALHAVSEMVGHAPVSTTLGTYAHLLDWSVGAHVCRYSVQSGIELKANTAELSQRQGRQQPDTLTGLMPDAMRKAEQRFSAGPPRSRQAEGGYARPFLGRERRDRGRPAMGGPPSVYLDTVLAAATRRLLKLSNLKLPTGETVVRRDPFVHPSHREPSADWLNWRLVKMVLEHDHEGATKAIIFSIAKTIEVPEEIAWEWVQNGRLFIASVSEEAAGRPNEKREFGAADSISLALRGSNGEDATLATGIRNFIRSPEGSEIPLVDRVWATAGRKAKPIWQRGLDVFRLGYSLEKNRVFARNWKDAKALWEVLRELNIRNYFDILHAPPPGYRRSPLNLSIELIRNNPPRPWRGGVYFRFKGRVTDGTGYAIRFALTMLTITEAAVIADARWKRISLLRDLQKLPNEDLRLQPAKSPSRTLQRGPAAAAA